MRVIVMKLTDVDLAKRACEFTLHRGALSTVNLKRLYASEHSPIRTQLYWIEMKNIPAFVSTHLVRHKVGVEHFVQTHRVDRGAEELANRETPVHHAMLINAQALINMARKRLCANASPETRLLMETIKNQVEPELAPYLVPDCDYRGGCYEFKCCGYKTKAPSS